MNSPAAFLPCPFTATERELILREMGLHFGQYPSLADGLFLRTWRGGPQKGEPKLPPAVQSMLERGLVELRAERTASLLHRGGAGSAAAVTTRSPGHGPGPLRAPTPGT